MLMWHGKYRKVLLELRKPESFSTMDMLVRNIKYRKILLKLRKSETIIIRL